MRAVITSRFRRRDKAPAVVGAEEISDGDQEKQQRHRPAKKVTIYPAWEVARAIEKKYKVTRPVIWPSILGDLQQVGSDLLILGHSEYWLDEGYETKLAEEHWIMQELIRMIRELMPHVDYTLPADITSIEDPAWKAYHTHTFYSRTFFDCVALAIAILCMHGFLTGEMQFENATEGESGKLQGVRQYSGRTTTRRKRSAFYRTQELYLLLRELKENRDLFEGKNGFYPGISDLMGETNVTTLTRGYGTLYRSRRRDYYGHCTFNQAMKVTAIVGVVALSLFLASTGVGVPGTVAILLLAAKVTAGTAAGVTVAGVGAKTVSMGSHRAAKKHTRALTGIPVFRSEADAPSEVVKIRCRYLHRIWTRLKTMEVRPFGNGMVHPIKQEGDMRCAEEIQRETYGGFNLAQPYFDQALQLITDQQSALYKAVNAYQELAMNSCNLPSEVSHVVEIAHGIRELVLRYTRQGYNSLKDYEQSKFTGGEEEYQTDTQQYVDKVKQHDMDLTQSKKGKKREKRLAKVFEALELTPDPNLTLTQASSKPC